uniref:Uncharacterized protein n=1 Tax=Falco tinnunculus TaxID=100819 RepID=A0A8C4UCW1_FALTI
MCLGWFIMLYHHTGFAAQVRACWSGPASPALWRHATCGSRGQDISLRNTEVEPRLV